MTTSYQPRIRPRSMILAAIAIALSLSLIYSASMQSGQAEIPIAESAEQTQPLQVGDSAPRFIVETVDYQPFVFDPVSDGADIDGVYDGAIELAHALAGSSQVQECVSSQWFRFAYNRTVTPEDSCSVEQLNEVFADSNFNVKALLVALTQTNAFLYRRAVELEPDATGGAQ